MTTVTKDFTAAGAGNAFSLAPGQSLDYAAAGTFTGFVELQRSDTAGQTWERVSRGAADTGISGTVLNETTHEVRYRFAAFDTDSETVITGTIETSLADVVNTVQEWRHPVTGAVLLRLTDEGVEVPKLTVEGATVLEGTLNAQVAPLHLAGDVYIYIAAGVPVDYTDGTPPATGEAVAGIGSLYIDITNGKVYVNGGTKAQPLWKIITSA